MKLFFEGNKINFEGKADDPEEGIFDEIIEWTLNTFDVKIGFGTLVIVDEFLRGMHVITATVTDSGGIGYS